MADDPEARIITQAGQTTGCPNSLDCHCFGFAVGHISKDVACSGAAGLEAPWPGLIAWPASLACCAGLPPSAAGHARRVAIAWRALTRLAGLHPLRISPHARAAGSRDTSSRFTLQYNTGLHPLRISPHARAAGSLDTFSRFTLQYLSNTTIHTYKSSRIL